jgi:hypothetical protein
MLTHVGQPSSFDGKELYEDEWSEYTCGRHKRASDPFQRRIRNFFQNAHCDRCGDHHPYESAEKWTDVRRFILAIRKDRADQEAEKRTFETHYFIP